MFDPAHIREDFPILSQQVNGHPLVYLDNAATAQKPLQVLEAMDDFMLRHNANIHRGIHRLSAESTQAYENARERVREFINAGESSEVIFTGGATAAINTVAYSFAERCLEPGDNVVVSEMEHHSNIVPWQIVCERKGANVKVLGIDDSGSIPAAELERVADDRTRLLAVTQASNVLGTRPDLKELVDTAHSMNIPVLVDGCQGVVHGGVDVRELDCDFYTFSGHKLYGPTGTGVLYGKRALLEELPPFMGGGDMVDTVSFEGTTFAELPLKFEAGTANYIGAVGLAAAIDYLSAFDAAELEVHEKNLMRRAVDGLESIGGITVYGNVDGKCPIVSFNADGVHNSDIGMVLDKLGIAVRTGTHCAQPLMARYGVTGMCRASFGLYNTAAEVDAFLAGVDRALSMLR